MRSAIKTLLFSSSLSLLLIGLVYSAGHVNRVQDSLIRFVARRRLSSIHNELLDLRQMTIVLCGTGDPAPDRDRAAACTAVFVAGHFFLVDVGPGSARNAGIFALPLPYLTAVLLTHFHSDHIGDLGEINTQSWIAGRSHPLPVYGPPGVKQVVDGFASAYALDAGYRVATVPMLSPRTWTMEPHAIVIPGSAQQTGATTVLEGEGLRITAFTVDHAPVTPAYGYRFDYRGRSVVISGDTAKSSNLIRAASDADLLIHEAQAKHIISIVQQVAGEESNKLLQQTLGDIQRYHSSPVEAAESANEAKVRLLVLSHLTPPQSGVLAQWAFLRGVSAIRPRGVEMGYDGMMIALPINSREIRVGRLK
jgi:ribonuclease Z